MKDNANSVGYSEFDRLLKRVEELEAKLEKPSEVVINTELVQYRVNDKTINCMLFGGHRFELTFETLKKLNSAYLSVL